LARFSRVLRLIRLMRWFSIFGALHLIVKAISSSFIILFWSLLIILTILCLVALAMNNILSPFIQDESNDLDVRTDLYMNWGSFTRAATTMFEATLANWGPICWLLTNNVSEWFALFFILYKCTIGFAVVQVILSVFIQQTFKVAAHDQEIMINEKRSQAEATLKQLTRLFEALDTSGDGMVSKEELLVVLGDPRVMAWFAAMGVDANDINELFTLMGDGDLAPNDFIEGVKSIRGIAKTTDMFEVKRQLQRVISLMGEMRMCLTVDRSSIEV